MNRFFTELSTDAMTLDEIAKAKLGSTYGWDDQNKELQYFGNPMSYWMTQREADVYKTLYALSACQPKETTP